MIPRWQIPSRIRTRRRRFRRAWCTHTWTRRSRRRRITSATVAIFRQMATKCRPRWCGRRYSNEPPLAPIPCTMRTLPSRVPPSIAVPPICRRRRPRLLLRLRRTIQFTTHLRDQMPEGSGIGRTRRAMALSGARPRRRLRGPNPGDGSVLQARGVTHLLVAQRSRPMVVGRPMLTTRRTSRRTPSRMSTRPIGIPPTSVSRTLRLCRVE